MVKQTPKEAVIYFRGDEMAADVWFNKYALRDKDGNVLEKTPHDTHARMASELVKYSQRYNDPLTFNECMSWFEGFNYIVPQGSIMYGLGNPYSLTSLSNCFVIDPPKDSYPSIMRTDADMVELMKRRGGVGTDVSNIRGVGEFIDNAAASSCGVTPIMERYSNTTREVGQGGRRGALMLSIDVNHRDIRDFINYKTNLKKCTGANVSVRIDDRFMNSVIIGDEGANKTFDMLVDANRRSGEPGILFWSTILRESPFAGYKGWEEKSTNPCVTGDTLVAVADGRGYVSFEQLAEEGKDVDVYCADANGNLKVRKMRNIRVSGFKEKLVSVHLDNGAVIKCTPNHRFFLKEANMIKCAKDLLLDDSIHVMSKVFVDGKDSRVIINTNGERFFEHRFLYESLVGEIGDKQIHHIDGNPYNNSLSNFMLVTPKEHNILHQKFYQKETNPNYSGISNDELWSMAVEATKLNGCRMSKRQLAKKINFNWSKWRSEVYGGLSIFLEKVADFCFEDKRLVKGEMRSVRKYRDSIKTNWNGSKDYGENENSEFYNHKVVKVSFDGEEADVYTGTVDEFHNYFLGGWESKTSSGRKKVSSLLTLQCGEIPLTDGDSCRLFAINFYGFVENKFSKTARFYFSKFRDACFAAVKMMDSVVDAEIDKISQIIAKIESDPEPEFEKAYSIKLWNHIKMRAEQGRRTGIGMTGLGDALAALGLKYGTRDASDFAEELIEVMSNNIYNASQELARTRGAAPLFNEEFDKKSAFLSRKGVAGVPRRHIGLLTCAPTGTVSLMTQTTSGIEPLFMAFYKRKKKDENGTIIDVVGDKFVEYFVIHQPFKDWLVLNNLKHDTIEELEEGFKLSPWYGATTKDIDHNEKVCMQGRIQQHIDHSISVTMNLPEGTTNETIRELYINAWQRGCKGLTVYVDGSREGVLNDVKSSGEKQNNIPVQPANAPATPLKRPKKLDGEVQFFRVGNEHWCAFVGLLEGKPYEVFLGNATNYPYLKKGSISEGVIEKTDDGYQFIANKVDGYGLTISGLGSMFNKEYWNYAKSVSGMLRNGMSIPAVIDIVEGLFDNDSLHSFKNGVIRVLKKYIKDGEKPTKHSDCPNCDNGNFVYQEGCLTCLNCGYSKCS